MAHYNDLLKSSDFKLILLLLISLTSTGVVPSPVLKEDSQIHIYNQGSVKKELKMKDLSPLGNVSTSHLKASHDISSMISAQTPAPSKQLATQNSKEEIVISEHTLFEIQNRSKSKPKDGGNAGLEEKRTNTHLPIENEELNGNRNVLIDMETKDLDGAKPKPIPINFDEELPITGFYYFLGLSCIGVLFIALKIYKTRLSRAERKYGVQGNRTTQELTPLPLAVEDANSDEDDHTLFELSQKQMRVFN